MANKKISAMTLLAAGDIDASADYIPIVDPSEAAAADRNKRTLVDSLTSARVIDTLGVNVTGTTIPANGIYESAADTFSIATASTLRVSVSTTAVTCTLPLGLGAAAPASKLHIDQPSNDRAGGIYIERNGSDYGLSLYVDSAGLGVIGSNGDFTVDIIKMDLNTALATFAGNITLTTGDLIITSPTTPASASATGTIGTIAWDTGFIYICTATDTWKRAAIATW